MPAPGQRLGMGAILHDGGSTFRVSAPDAGAVSVAGDFTTPQWQAGAVAMARDSNNPSSPGFHYWSCFVPGVAAGAQYRFLIQNKGLGPGNQGGPPFWRMDPYWQSNAYGDDCGDVGYGTTPGMGGKSGMPFNGNVGARADSVVNP